MKDTITIGRILGIPLKVHWSFWILFFYVVYNVMVVGSYYMMIYLIFLFSCVVLHEYGHAMAARYYGINTKDIILSPLGGVARLMRMPHDPLKEIFIALAGPLVNFVLFLIFFGLVYIRGKTMTNFIPNFENGDFIVMAAMTNGALFVFNLIPAFPMDGGRILRAVLSFFTSRGRATLWASMIGRGLALLLIGFSLFIGQYLYVIMGIVLFSMAASESQEAMAIEKLENYFVKDFYSQNIGQIIPYESTIEDAFELWKHNGISHFIIMDVSNQPYCWIGKQEFIDAIKNKHLNQYCHEHGIHTVSNIGMDVRLSEAVETMHQALTTVLVVIDKDGGIIGTIDYDAINRAMIL